MVQDKNLIAVARPKMLSVAHGTLLRERKDDAEDVVQEALLTASESLQGKVDPVAWLCGITRNKAREHNRRYLRDKRPVSHKHPAFWPSLLETWEDTKPVDLHSGSTHFEFARAYQYGRHNRVLSFAVEGNDTIVDFFCWAVNVAHHFCDRKESDFHVLLAWIANEFSGLLHVLAPTVLPDSTYRARLPWQSKVLPLENLSQLAKRYRYRGGAAELERMIQRYKRYRPEPRCRLYPVHRFSWKKIPGSA